MRRDDLLCFLGALALVWPLPAEAQQSGKIYRLGFVSMNRPDTGQHLRVALREGLRERGWIEGQNFVFDFRWADSRSDRLSALAVDLVQAKVDMIITGSTAAARAAMTATTSIPIILAASTDAVADGLVVSLAHPGGNVTGMTTVAHDMVSKHLELLKQLVPSLTRVDILVNPGNVGHLPIAREAEAGSRALGLQLNIARAAGPSELPAVFKAMRGERNRGLVVMADSMFFGDRAAIATLALEAGVPTVAQFNEHAAAGTLVTYGPKLPDMYRRAAGYIDKVLKGARPADLPIEQPTTFELVINMKTAKALGLSIPPVLLARADELIE
jgi:putative ABC transport system substrate-binding protein